MLTVIRVDASERIGTGHVARCLALAEVLRQRGGDVRFVCRRHHGNLVALIEERAYPVHALSEGAAAGGSGEDYRAWLGVPAVTDATETVEAFSGRRPDWLVVDHYGLDQEWERLVRPHVEQMLVIDDLADRQHDCELLLDQTYSPDPSRRYDGLVPRRCEVLSGPRYALLSSEYVARRRAPGGGSVRRVLVYFGGSDIGNLTGRVLAVLSAPEFSHLEADVVIGANNLHRVALERQAAERPLTRVHGMRPHLADLMAASDLAIGAGGVTTWERMCVGVPAVVLSLAENQRPTCEALSAVGLIQYVGEAGRVDAVAIAAGLSTLMNTPGRMVAMSMGGHELVDGHGASRVVDHMRTHDSIREAR